MEYKMSVELMENFRGKLLKDEKSMATIEKYMRDLRRFKAFMGNEIVTKERVIGYKQMLVEDYAPASVNSMLAALNHFFKDVGWYECIVKSIKIQRSGFRSKDQELSKEEYYRLLEAAKNKKDLRLYYLMKTICATGIRVSELKFVTVEALYSGHVIVSMKGKVRTVILPASLCKKLKCYIKERGINSGPIFVTRSGRPVDRNNISHEMKALAKLSGVSGEKIFPHNLRHLFANVYYKKEKDVFGLADILGHSNVNTTRIYTRVSRETKERQIDQMGLVV